MDHITIRGLTIGMSAPGREDLRALAADGFRSVVDLRTHGENQAALSPSEESEELQQLGLNHRHIPVETDRLDPADLDRFRQAIDALPRPTFVHCASGKRSGSFAMAHAAIETGISGAEMLRRADDLGVLYGSDAIREIFGAYVDHHRIGQGIGVAQNRRFNRSDQKRAARTALPGTTTRVARHTAEAINRRIADEIGRSVRYHAAHPEAIDGRLRELDREWDIERVLEANAAALALTGTLLGGFVDRRFLVLPVAVTSFLLQHALQGWCPPVPFFRKRGVRTAAEINRERAALKALRGDFRSIERVPAGARADAALQAAQA